MFPFYHSPNYYSLRELQEIVQDGNAKRYFKIGQQLHVKWSYNKKCSNLDVPLDIVSFRNATLENGNIIPTMYLQWHDIVPYVNLHYDMHDFIYYAEDGLEAGRYYFEFPANSSNNYYVNFILQKDAPKKSYIFYTRNSYFLNDSEIIVYSTNKGHYEEYHDDQKYIVERTNAIFSPIVLVTFDKLGVIAENKFDSYCNSVENFFCGRTSYKDSDVRGYLNATTSDWWTPKHQFDFEPLCITDSTYGFMQGYEDEFLDILQKVKVTTISPKEGKTYDTYDTYDTFFLPSVHEEFTRLDDDDENEARKHLDFYEEEGEVFEYYKRADKWYNAYRRDSMFIKKILGTKDGHACYAYRSIDVNNTRAICMRMDNVGRLTSQCPAYGCNIAPCCVIG